MTIKVSALAEITDVQTDDLLMLVRGGANKKIKQQNFTGALGATSLKLATTEVGQRAADRDIALAATETWEQGGCAEPNVYLAGGQYHMIYRGGNTAGRIGWATAPSRNGPWTKQNGALPILGGGAGGESGQAVLPSILVEGGVLNIYYSDNGGVGDIKVATAPATNPAAVTVVGTVLTHSGGKFYNTTVIRDTIGASGGTYLMIVEFDGSGAHPFSLAVATASTSTGTFTKTGVLNLYLPNPISTSAAGSAEVHIEDGRYVLFYHAAINNSGGDLPTEVYRAISTDLVNFVTATGPFAARATAQEYDQTADPAVCADAQEIHFYWSGVNNAYGVSPVAPASNATAWSYVMHAKGKAPSVSDIQLIGQRILGAAATLIDFENLDQSFESLIIEIQGRGDAALTTIGVKVRANNDSGPNYYSQGLSWIGSTTGGNAAEAKDEFIAQTTWTRLGALTAASATAARAGMVRATIPNYRGTSWHKTFQSNAFNSYSNLTANQLAEQEAGVWASAAAINRLTFIPSSGNFAAGTVINIYGIR